MCGIFGAISRIGEPLRRPSMLTAMATRLHHRGPDSARIFRSPESALGATRLRINDLSASADQPFCMPGGGFWLACNGEIYNSAALRRRFSAYPFRTRSDVESLLPCVATQGVDALREIDGMFAIAIWYPQSRRLILARDIAGEKPLCYAVLGREVWFASEVQALLGHPDLRRDIDPVAVSQFLTFGYVLEPRTLFRQIRRVQAGTALIISATGFQKHRFSWPRDLVRDERVIDGPAATAELRQLVVDAVTRQLTADTDVGVFMSGGVDSSLIAAIAAAQAPKRLITFTARFTAASYDESRWARREAQRLGTKHVEVSCDDGSLNRALHEISRRTAEPISDPAILPTYLLAEAARQQDVRVVLSGEGADELFGGYPTYLGHNFADRYASLPGSLRSTIERLVRAIPASDRKVSLDFLLKRFVAGAARPWPERHVEWFGTGWSPRVERHPDREWLAALLQDYRDLDALRGAMLFDYCTYLRDNLLVKLDRAAMLNSVESRAPALDRHLTAFAFGLPPRLKCSGLTSKWLWKEAARAWLPDAIVDRRKRGLSVPVASWINGALRTWTDQLLDPAALDRYGLIDAAFVHERLMEHRAGRANHARALWSVIMLQSWLERWHSGLAAATQSGDRTESENIAGTSTDIELAWIGAPGLAGTAAVLRTHP